MEMVSTIVHQLTRNMTMEQIKESGFDTYFVDHTAGIWPQAASGMPFYSVAFASDVRDPIKFLREREIVHFQRFGEALRVVQDNLDSKNYYAYNPEFDRPGPNRCR